MNLISVNSFLIVFIIFNFQVIHVLCNHNNNTNNNNTSENLDENISNILKIFAPISQKIKNAECRKQSLLYIRELHKFTLWATQMFDSATKFPNGVLVGSTYDLGNFDECLQVDVNVAKQNIKGKYCLASIKFAPMIERTPNMNINPWSLNGSTWDRIQFLSKDPSKRARDEIHWAFCIPSACTHTDLKIQLEEVLEQYQKLYNIKASIDVKPHLCQTSEPLNLTLGGIALLIIVGLFILFLGLATTYDFLTSMRSFRHITFQKTPHEVLMAFSLSNNLKKLLKFEKQEDGLDCIHGLKFSSMCMIIMGHRILFVLGSPILNSDFIESFYSKIEAMFLLNGPIIVDSFFNISGFLVCYLLLLEFRKREQMINVPMLYLHRLIRLTPAYVVVLAFYGTLFVKIGSGPLWLEKVGTETERCSTYWWANLLYVNNYIHPEKMCMIQSWYLTCDMHLFMISPFLVYLLWKKPTVGKIVLTLCIFGSILIAFCTVYFGKLDALLLLYMKTLRDPLANKTFRGMYIPTHTRAGPYFTGMAAGYIRYKIKLTNFQIPTIIVWFGWIISIFCCEAAIFSAHLFYLPGREYDPMASAVYGSFHRIAWSIGVSWMIIAMSTGNGAFIEPVFSWKPVITLSRLSYSAFLVHGGLQLYTVACARMPFYGSFYNLFWYSLGDVTLSFIGGLALTLSFESPIIALEKILLRKVFANTIIAIIINFIDSAVKKQTEEVENNNIKKEIKDIYRNKIENNNNFQEVSLQQ